MNFPKFRIFSNAEIWNELQTHISCLDKRVLDEIFDSEAVVEGLQMDIDDQVKALEDVDSQLSRLHEISIKMS